MKKLKQVIVLREDLDISEGKRIAQACHASLESYKKADEDSKAKWQDSGYKKIVLEAENNRIRQALQASKDLQIPAALVKDAGLTEVDPRTLTALGVGPAIENKINKVTGDMRLVK